MGDRAVDSARVLTRRNGAAADQKTASDLIRLGGPSRKSQAVQEFERSGTGPGGRIIEPGVFQVDSAETIERVPIHTDADGVVRVAGTRVTLDTVVAAFDAGATAEEIAQQYPSVALADVCSVITYYLRHQSDVCAYLQKRQQQAATVRQENERRFPPSGVRERLLARRR